jgi:hypothetical protein
MGVERLVRVADTPIGRRWKRLTYSVVLSVLVVNLGGQVGQAIASLVSSTTAGIIGVVVVIASAIAAAIISGMEDDYYGTDVFAFLLLTNVTDFVHSLPKLAEFGPGTTSENGEFEIAPEFHFFFQGESGLLSAVATDGEVEIRSHWVFSSRSMF